MDTTRHPFRRVTNHRLFPEGLPVGCSITIDSSLIGAWWARLPDLPAEAEAQGRSVRSWLQPEDPLCHSCLGTGWGEGTDFREGCLWCNGEGVEINRPTRRGGSREFRGIFRADQG